MTISVKGFSSNMYGWVERWKSDGREPAWDDILRACAEAGLDAVEIDATPEKLALVRKYGLSVSGSYVGLPLHEEYEVLDVERTVLPFADRLAEAGGTDLLLNADPYGGWKERLPKPEELAKRQGDNLSRIAELVAPLGLKLSLHNHAADRHNAEMDLRSVVEFAAPSVGLCVDAGWAHVSGCDPVEWVRRWPERIAAFHLRNQRGRVPAEDLLEGDLDFASLLQAASSADYRGWLALELWHPAETAPIRSMTEDVQRSIMYLQTLLTQQGAGA